VRERHEHVRAVADPRDAHAVERPSRSRIVSASASAWHGCSTSVSALITGIDAASAHASSSSCESVRIASASR
jgi:hypothetical protein